MKISLPERLRRLADHYEQSEPHTDNFVKAKPLVMNIIRELVEDWI